MDAVFPLCERGTSFATRSKAHQVVDELKEYLSVGSSKNLTIDMAGVRVITPSFAIALIESIPSLLSNPRFRMESVSIVGDRPLVQRRLQQALDQYRDRAYATRNKAQSFGKILIS